MQTYPYICPQQIHYHHTPTEPRPVRIEEILMLLLFVCLGIYAVGHMLFIPIEILVIAFCLDPDLKKDVIWICFFYLIKYISMGFMFYCAYHHVQLWNRHHRLVLYLMATFCILSTGIYVFFTIMMEEGLRRHGFGPIYDHPIFYDLVGFIVCGVQGFIYILYIACTKPATYFLIPAYDVYGGMVQAKMGETLVQLQETAAPKRQYPVPICYIPQ